MNKTFTRKIVLLAAALALMGAGCFQAKTDTGVVVPPPAPAPEPTPAPIPLETPAHLDEDFSLKIGETRDVESGLRVTLEAIGDSRCKPDVQCIWAGELSPKLRIELADGSKPSQELILGTTTKQKADALGYSFTLVSATDKEATLNVTK